MTTTRRRRNVAKLLARLNPKGMALQPSAGNTRGGIPEETALDIAGALGYVSAQGPGPRLAAVALCLRWWPGLIEGPMKVVGYRQVEQTSTSRRVAGDREPVSAIRALPPPLRTSGGRRLTRAERARAMDVRLQRPAGDDATAERLARPRRDEDGRLVWEHHTSTRVDRVPVEAPTETAAFLAVASMLEHRLLRRAVALATRAAATSAAAARALAAAEERARDFAATLGTDEDVLREVVAARAALADAARDYRMLDRVASSNFVAAWARAVITEYRNPNHCQTCTPWGRAGEVPRPVEQAGKVVRVEWQTCETCAGGGTLAWSTKRRAKALHINEHLWREYLNPIHGGALALLRELEWRAATALVRRLGG